MRSGGGGAQSLEAPHFVDVVKVLRVLKVLKVLRVLRGANMALT